MVVFCGKNISLGFLMHQRKIEKYNMPSLRVYLLCSVIILHTILILLGHLINVHMMMLIFTEVEEWPFFQ